MIIGNFAFNTYIQQFGETVTIENQTPELDDNGDVIQNEAQEVVYNPVQPVTVQCRIVNNRGSEVSKMRFMGAFPTMEEADAIGLFKLSDAQYLNKGNKIILSRNLSYTFEMLNPVEKKTHIEVTLKRNNV
jgi:hypothetical protein